MSADEADIDDAVLILNCDDDSISVTLYIEHDPIVRDEACVAIDLLDIRGASPVGMYNVCIPGLQRLSGVGVFLPEYPKRLTGDDPHVGIVLCSHNGNKG